MTLFARGEQHGTPLQPTPPFASTTRRRRRCAVTFTAVACSAGAVLGLTVAPATARQDAGPTPVGVQDSRSCPLERVGTQYTRCDMSTGNGVPAPAWVPER